MRVGIFGCRDGAYLCEQIKKAEDSGYEAVCFCDNNVELHNTRIAGLPVVSAEELAERYHAGQLEAVIIAVRKGYSRFCIIEQLKEQGIEEIILMKPSPLTFHLPILFHKEEPGYARQWLKLSEVRKPLIHHLEINIADGCNLNCRGCLHFSNLFQKDEFPDAAELLAAIEQVARHCEIFQFRVLGGEPLLYPGLGEFLVQLRKILPDTDIAVISNGILIPKMPEELYQIMRENEIGFNLTLYLPTLKMKDRIYDTLKQHQVSYGSHEARTDRFEKFLMLEPAETEENVCESCYPRGILVIREGRLYRCPVEAYIYKYYEYFQINLKAPKGVKLFEEGQDWEQLIYDLYTKPRPLCAYCSKRTESFAWGNGKAEQEDWLVSKTGICDKRGDACDE